MEMMFSSSTSSTSCTTTTTTSSSSSSSNSSRQGLTFSSLFVLLLLLFLQLEQQHCVRAQQSYLNNKQHDCNNNATDVTQGFVCNGVNKSCSSYLTFRPNPPYNTPASISHLLGSSPSLIASLNNISSPNSLLPASSIILVPVTCSCSGGRYQHNASYTLTSQSETYYTVANLTYGGLTTCQSLMSHNPYGMRKLSVGLTLQVPLMCACPTSNQSAAGFNFLLSYLVTWGENIDSIAATFSVPPLSVFEANQLEQDHSIYPFTPILVPLRTHPTAIKTMASPPPAAPSPPLSPTVPAQDSSGSGSGSGSSSHKWIFVGVGVGAALLAALIAFFLFCFRRRRLQGDSVPSKSNKPSGSTADNYYSDWQSSSAAINQSSSWSLSTQGIQYALESLMVYKFQDIQKATDYFSESNRIQASVYRGSFNGDSAAVKMMKGDVSAEINILKKINHSNVIRLSGFCLHEGNTYLVYEYAEKGSLDNWIHSNSKDIINQQTVALSWQQRVQIACDVADSLNYLHNFVNPPYIHKNLKSSNILLDGNLRAKVTNFGLARTVSTDDVRGLQLTRHVVGTQGYMAPEYIENGVITPKLDVFAFGVVLLELLSGKEATAGEKNGQQLLHASIDQVLEGDNVREKLQRFVDPSLGNEFPLDLAFSMATLAKSCVAHDMNSRPGMSEILMTLSKVVSSSLGWDPSDELDRTTSGRDHYS